MKRGMAVDADQLEPRWAWTFGEPTETAGENQLVVAVVPQPKYHAPETICCVQLPLGGCAASGHRRPIASSGRSRRTLPSRVRPAIEDIHRQADRHPHLLAQPCHQWLPGHHCCAAQHIPDRHPRRALHAERPEGVRTFMAALNRLTERVPSVFKVVIDVGHLPQPRSGYNNPVFARRVITEMEPVRHRRRPLYALPNMLGA